MCYPHTCPYNLFTRSFEAPINKNVTKVNARLPTTNVQNKGDRLNPPCKLIKLELKIDCFELTSAKFHAQSIKMAIHSTYCE